MSSSSIVAPFCSKHSVTVGGIEAMKFEISVEIWVNWKDVISEMRVLSNVRAPWAVELSTHWSTLNVGSCNPTCSKTPKNYWE